jgi:hypothetical protein
MPIGDDNDFRMVGFRQVKLFDGQDHIGGTGSAMLSQETSPFGGSNASSPSPPGTTIALGDNNFTFPGVILPTVQPPIINISGGGGTTTPQLLLTGGSVVIPTSVSQIDFTGTGLFSLTESGGIATVNYQDTGGGPGGGSVLVYGRISSSVKNPTRAIWTYTVALLFPGSGNVTAYNLLEENNGSTVAYGYTLDTSVADRDKIFGTNYKIYGVPNGTLVRMELTNSMTGGGATEYWFSAPNFIDGGC